MNGSDWVTPSEACALAQGLHTSATITAIRKSIIGMASEGCLPAFAGEYSESASALDDGPDRIMGSVFNDYIPRDFWQYEMATNAGSGSNFERGGFIWDIESTAAELPHRFFKTVRIEFQSPRYQLIQSAINVRFSKCELLALMGDRAWKQYGESISPANRARRRGVAKQWAWDTVKARLTVDAANDPALLSNGVAPIVEKILNEFIHLTGGNHPDISHVYKYAGLVLSANASPDDGPPAD